MSQRAVTAFELTPDAEAQVNQALGELKTEIFRMEAERVEKHSDWHYTVGAFSKEEVKSLRAGFRSHLDNHLEAIHAEALTALAFNHDYFFDDPYKELEVTMIPSLNHLEIQFGSRIRQLSIPYEGPFIPTRNTKRLSHAIDFEPTWRLAFEETRKRLEAAK